MIQSDEPIKQTQDDLLNRSHLAAVIAGEIRRIDASEGFVVGVLGPWGSGKTSLINLIRVELGKDAPLTVLDFNPWMFSGADDLVERFFVELSEQLGQKPGQFEEIAKHFARFSRIVAPLKYLPIAGSLFEGAKELGEIVKSVAEERKGGVEEHRQRLRKALEELATPIVVVIDDIDRLGTNEVRDIFKLVRLTANFPKVIYIVAFDRARVEHALSEDGIVGRDYLEKIIQAAYDMPAVPVAALHNQLIAAINHALADVPDPGPFDSDRWVDVLVEIVQPLFRNVRDVRRYAASLAGTVRSLDGKVALVDVLALEAIRVFIPDLLASVCRNQDPLTAVSGDFMDTLVDPGRKEAIAAFLAQAGDRRKVAETIIARLFPAAIRHLEGDWQGSGSKAQWARDRRVADPHLLAYFCERVAGSRLQGNWAAERMVQVVGDKDQFESKEAALGFPR